MELDTTRTVRELTLEIPGSTRVFEKLGIDYCCGGERTFADACAAAGLSTKEVTESLEEALQQGSSDSTFIDWQSERLPTLVSHIMETHHTFTREQLRRIEPLVDKVYEAHGQKHQELLRIRSLFQALKQDLIPHMQKEEMILFPYVEQLVSAADAGLKVPAPFFGTVRNPIRMMMVEHDRAGEILKEMRKTSSGFKVPADGCASYQSLYNALEEFEQDLHQHIHLENNILFPRAVEMEGSV